MTDVEEPRRLSAEPTHTVMLTYRLRPIDIIPAPITPVLWLKKFIGPSVAGLYHKDLIINAYIIKGTSFHNKIRRLPGDINRESNSLKLLGKFFGSKIISIDNPIIIGSKAPNTISPQNHFKYLNLVIQV